MSKQAKGQFQALFQPGNIGRLRLSNRIIMAAMGNPLADENGFVTQRMVDHYRARARGGAGLIIPQFISVSRDATPPNTPAIYEDRFIPGLARIANAVHEEGGKIAIQLMHHGLVMVMRQNLPPGMTVKVPSIIPCLPGGKTYQVVTTNDIDRYVEDFAESARRCREAGADGVEVHANHGCLVSTFLSPATNRRTDEYGGSTENRTRFAREILARIRERAGAEFPVWVRINGREDTEGGLTIEEAVKNALILESAGASAISLSEGLEAWPSTNVPCYLLPDGYMAPMAERMKKSLKVPVMTAGKILPELAEQIIRQGKADFIALGRPLLADPELPNRLRNGRAEDINRCIYCSNCTRMGRRLCSVNPFMYRDSDFPFPPASPPKKVMVVGGGPAGMQAAVLLAGRGHKVRLYEKENEPGGQWNIASAMPGKEGFTFLTERLKSSLDRLGVPVELGTTVTREKVVAEKPDVVVIATGATPAGLDVPGATLSKVVQANDVITGKAKANGAVVVIGGHTLGMEMATWLAETGSQVSLVSRGGLGGKRGPDESHIHALLTRKLVELRVPLYLNATVLEITKNGVAISLGGQILSLPADTVVLAVGAKPENRLTLELKGLVPELYTIGDCVEARHVAIAVLEAAEVAAKI